jgi:hypothetical protein
VHLRVAVVRTISSPPQRVLTRSQSR